VVSVLFVAAVYFGEKYANTDKPKRAYKSTEEIFANTSPEFRRKYAEVWAREQCRWVISHVRSTPVMRAPLSRVIVTAVGSINKTINRLNRIHPPTTEEIKKTEQAYQQMLREIAEEDLMKQTNRPKTYETSQQ
jgi:hypothetical protein